MRLAGRPTVLAKSRRSPLSISLFNRIRRLAREVSVSASRAPRATFSISSFSDTEGLRSSGRVTSSFFDFVTPTASTMTK